MAFSFGPQCYRCESGCIGHLHRLPTACDPEQGIGLGTDTRMVTGKAMEVGLGWRRVRSSAPPVQSRLAHLPHTACFFSAHALLEDSLRRKGLPVFQLTGFFHVPSFTNSLFLCLPLPLPYILPLPQPLPSSSLPTTPLSCHTSM